MEGPSSTDGCCGGSGQAAASEGDKRELVFWKGLQRKRQQSPKPTTEHSWFYRKQGFLQSSMRNQQKKAFHSPRICSLQPDTLQTFKEASPSNVDLSLFFSELEKAASSKQNKPGRKRRNDSSKHKPSAATLSSSQSQRNPAGLAPPKHTVPSGKSIWPHPCCPCSCCQCLNRGC